MESNGRRALRNLASTNMRYSATMYNVEEVNEEDVHEPVTVLGMADM